MPWADRRHGNQGSASCWTWCCLFVAAWLQVRPVVHEELRLEADDEMRRLIQSIKAKHISTAPACLPVPGFSTVQEPRCMSKHLKCTGAARCHCSPVAGHAES